jgi:hypothetical protein
MPSHYGGSDKKEKKAPMKKKSSGDLTNEQIAKLSKHKFAHSAEHIAMMRKLMKEGMSFTAAHNKAMREVGK